MLKRLLKRGYLPALFFFFAWGGWQVWSAVNQRLFTQIQARTQVTVALSKANQKQAALLQAEPVLIPQGHASQSWQRVWPPLLASCAKPMHIVTVSPLTIQQQAGVRWVLSGSFVQAMAVLACLAHSPDLLEPQSVVFSEAPGTSLLELRVELRAMEGLL
jgi:hypothetical protein